MAILNKRISSATLPQLQKNTRLESIIRDVASAPAVTNDTFRTINPSMSASNAISPAYVSQLTSALREMQGGPQNVTSRISPTQSNNVSLMSSQMPDMSAVPNISKGPITSITSPGDSPRQKIGSTTTTSGGVSNAVINALAGAVMGAGAQKILAGGNKSGSQTGGNKSSNNSSSSNLPAWAKGNPTIKDNGNGTYTQTNDDGSKTELDKDGNIIGTTDSNGDIVDKSGNTVHDNGDGTHTITARDGTVTIRNDDGTDITDQNAKVVPAPVDDYTEYPVVDDVPENKKGGLAVMMKDGGVPHFADAGVVTSTDTTSDPVQSLLDLLKTSGGAAGAGGLLAALLSSTGGNQNTQNTGLDMSTYGLLKPRTTNFGMGPAKYVTQRDYSPQSTYKRNDELLHNLNAPASNPVNEGDYTPNYVTNRPNTNQNWTGGTDINAIIAQIVNALKNQQLAQNVNQASGTTGGTASVPTSIAGVQTGGTGTSGISTTGPASSAATAPVTAEQKLAYKQWMLAQPNPAGPGTMADVYKAQGVDPMKDPRVDAQAQSEVERANRRKDLYASSGVSAPNNLSPWEDKDWQKYQGSNKEAYTLGMQAKSDPAAYAKLKRDNGWDDATAQSWIMRATDPTAWNAQAAVNDAKAGLVAGPTTPKAPTAGVVDPNKPWETASSDPNIKSVQDQLAQLNATQGTQAQRQAALDNFLATTKVSAADLAKATNGMWSATDILDLMIKNGNPIGQETEIARPTSPSRSRALGVDAGSFTDTPPLTEPSDLVYKLNAFSGQKSPVAQTSGVPLLDDPSLGYQNPGSSISQMQNDLYPPQQPISYGGDGGLYGPGGMFPSRELDPNSIYQNPGNPIVRSGKTPEEEAMEAMARASSTGLQSLADFAPDENYYGNYGSKDGGAIHKATGGLTHYTYGKPADVMENLGLREQQMAQGGLPHVSNVPVVQGRMDFRQGSAVHGEGDGQSDDIPAMLADGEYVIDAETVAQIGNGSTKAGAQALDKFRESIRAHKRSAPINKIPPKTKALTSYLKVK